MLAKSVAAHLGAFFARLVMTAMIADIRSEILARASGDLMIVDGSEYLSALDGGQRSIAILMV